MKYITKVYVFKSGMVAVFDENLAQWPDFQGKWSELRKKIFQQLALQDYDAEIYMN